MRPPFRSASFPCLRQWGACCPPRVAKTLQRGCTSLRPSCWPLDLVGKCSLAPLARSWLGRLAFARLPPLSARSARSRHCSACLGYSPPDRLAGVRPPFRSSARSARSFLRFTPKIKAVFSRKKSVRGERTFFPKMAYLVFVPPPLHKNIIRKKVLYITRSYVTFFIPPPLATGNVT